VTFFSVGGENNMSRGNLISCIVLAKNEEARIGACLTALFWSHERIVVDNGSTDKTAEIAQKMGARVVSMKNGDFSALRNAGMQAAGGTWILYVDADEVVPAGLASEIQEAVSALNPTKPVAYEIARENHYLGRKWPYQDRHLRLFKKSALKGWQGALHESPIVEGQTGRLAIALIHSTHRTLSEMVAKTNEWSQTEAKLRLDAGHPRVAPWRLFRVMATAFFDSFIKQGGWKAGWVGWIESLYQAFSMFVTYAKLWEMQKKSQK
jgi:glycosyltransferase involved in cell wall biosynthesis